MDIRTIDSTYVADTYARFPLTLVSGEGSVVRDEAGKEYIDLGTGIAVNTFGIADPVWVSAVTAQLGRLQHTSNLYYSEPCARLAETLCRRTGMKKVFFGNSGAEANECAVKVARKYAAEHTGEDHFHIITMKNSFHGRTLTTLAATGQDVFHEKFRPLTPGFVSVEPNDIGALKAAAAEHPAAGVLVEVVQGEGGVKPLDFGYLREAEAFCRGQGMLFMVDEVQTGNGRTGTLYAYMQAGLQPDVVTTAKGLGGGLPIGACMIGERAEHTLGRGDHGSTFGGNPAVCAGALSVLERVDEKLLADVRAKSAYIFDALRGAPGVLGVSGLGLMIGIRTARPAKDVVAACMENGVLCLTAKDRVRLLPALNIPMPLLQRAVEVLLRACA